MSERDFDIDYSERAGFLAGRSAALADWVHRKDKAAFAKLVNALRVRKWERDHANHASAAKKARANRPEARAVQLRGQKRRRMRAWKPDATVRTCKLCGTQWCRVVPRIPKTGKGHNVGPPSAFCCEAHARRWRYEQRRKDPAWAEANRARAAAWYEAKKRKGLQ